MIESKFATANVDRSKISLSYFLHAVKHFWIDPKNYATVAKNTFKALRIRWQFD
jgi:ABC-type Zn uptake system ZnuABC Zn-binding protein ZnuA